jgi:hypothetical protein
MVVVTHGRATTAPWSKAALAEWGSSTTGLHDAAQAAYPDVRGQSLLSRGVQRRR